MNEFLKRWALTEQNKRLNRTYLIQHDASQPYPGFVTVGAAQVARELTGPSREEIRYAEAPALLIGRLAVDSRFQGRGLGKALVRAARLMAFALPVGCRFLAVHVDEDNRKAIALYQSEGFRIPEGYEPKRGLLLMVFDLATTRPATSAGL